MIKKILPILTLTILFVSLFLSIKNQKLKEKNIGKEEKSVEETSVQSQEDKDLVNDSASSSEEEEVENFNASLAYLLENYASEGSSPHADIEAVASVLFSMKRELQGVDTRYLATNKDIANVLLGDNKYKMKLLPKNASIFNSEKQLIDRWGSPYRFHLQSAKEIEIRSAGPDKEMFTGDDLLRRGDGVFLNSDGALPR